MTMPSPAGKPLVLITGANQGLGYSTALKLATSYRFHVLLAARTEVKAQGAVTDINAARGTDDISDLTPLTIDLDSDVTIIAAAKFLKDRFGHLDILINNAGISRSPDPSATLRQNYQAVFATNVFGVAVMNATFLPLLRASKYHDRRIVNVSSGLGQIGMAYSTTSEHSAKVWEVPAYRSSKSAINMITCVDAMVLAKENILSVVACPGHCRTNFTDGQGGKSPEERASPTVRAATEGDPKALFGKIVDDENYLGEFGW